MLVCLALWMAARAATDSAKLVVLWWGLLAFIASGFEHSIANMTALSLAALTGVGEWSELGRNLLYTIPGNVVGGGVIVGLAYALIGTKPKASAPASANGSSPTPETVRPIRTRSTAKKAPAKKTATRTTRPARVPAAAGTRRANGR
jgi:hypothetical protein